MKINKNNYEVWMIDYFDGKLSAVEIDELMVFIDDHPKIREEFDAFQLAEVVPEKMVFSGKNTLKKDNIKATSNIDEDNYEQFFIAYYEGDLSVDELKEVLEFVALNPVIESEFQFHNRLSSVPDEKIKYPEKSSLKRKIRIPIIWQITRIAAVVLLLVGFYLILNDNEPATVIRTNAITFIDTKSLPVAIQVELDQINISSISQLVEIPEASITDNTAALQYDKINHLSKRNTPILLSYTNTEIEMIRYDIISYNDNELLAEKAKKERKKVFGRIIENIARRVSDRQPENVSENSTNEPGIVKALGTGITVFNTITGSDTELVKSYDQQGKYTGYYVEGQTIGWSRNISQNTE